MAKPRDLYIVATDRKELYELLRKHFADNEHVEVIFDRRHGEQRPARATKAEKRRNERRLADEAHLLNTLGVILVSRDRDQVVAKAGAKASRRGRDA
ncbi:MAG: hypothetical protein HYU25_11780 [Candidatus Rokubacteria bacterium]|nr:hypothetical protein [Candidatus Rokubacteria bacterium]